MCTFFVHILYREDSIDKTLLNQNKPLRTEGLTPSPHILTTLFWHVYLTVSLQFTPLDPGVTSLSCQNCESHSGVFDKTGKNRLRQVIKCDESSTEISLTGCVFLQYVNNVLLIIFSPNLRTLDLLLPEGKSPNFPKHCCSNVLLVQQYMRLVPNRWPETETLSIWSSDVESLWRAELKQCFMNIP